MCVCACVPCGGRLTAALRVDLKTTVTSAPCVFRLNPALQLDGCGGTAAGTGWAVVAVGDWED